MVDGELVDLEANGEIVRRPLRIHLADDSFDVIIVGAGEAGLIAASDAGLLTRFLLYDKQYEAAIAAGKELLEVDEEYGRGFVWMGSAHLALGISTPRSTGSSAVRHWTAQSGHTM